MLKIMSQLSISVWLKAVLLLLMVFSISSFLRTYSIFGQFHHGYFIAISEGGHNEIQHANTHSDAKLSSATLPVPLLDKYHAVSEGRPDDLSMSKSRENNYMNLHEGGKPVSLTTQGVLTRQDILSSNRPYTPTPLLFHLIHTTDVATFGTMQQRCIDSIFYHHPNAQIKLYIKHSNQSFPINYLMSAGYDIRLVPYDPHSILERLKRNKLPVNVTKEFGEHHGDRYSGELFLKLKPATIEEFQSQLESYIQDPKGYWHNNESNLLRLVLMYLEGGIYLGESIGIRGSQHTHLVACSCSRLVYDFLYLKIRIQLWSNRWMLYHETLLVGKQIIPQIYSTMPY